MKGAQLGWTEYLLNVTLHSVDIRRKSVLYVLPNKTPDAKDFSSVRFDGALEQSDYLSSIFSDIKNVGLKQSGDVAVYIRGSRSATGLKSIPTPIILLDEYEEMSPAAVALVDYRQSGQLETFIIKNSTPKIEGEGIHLEYVNSSMGEFYFICPGCSRWITLTYPESFVLTGEDLDDVSLPQSHYRCTRCDKKLDHELKADIFEQNEWVFQHANRDKSGYWINQLFSTTKGGRPLSLAKNIIEARLNPAVQQELYNSALGLPKTPEGARITDALLQDALSNYDQPCLPYSGRTITMGIDVGIYCHWVILEYSNSRGPYHLEQAQARLIAFGKTTSFAELEAIADQFRPVKACIDAQPERRKSYELCMKFPRIFNMVFYIEGVQSKMAHEAEEETTTEPSIKVDRTSWLDLTLGRFHNKTIKLPMNVDVEYRNHIKAQVRWPKRNEKNEVVYEYIKAANAQDHYAHAQNYAEIAYLQSFSISFNKNIAGV